MCRLFEDPSAQLHFISAGHGIFSHREYTGSILVETLSLRKLEKAPSLLAMQSTHVSSWYIP